MKILQERPFEIAAYLGNIVLTALMFLGFIRLWQLARSSWATSGGLPPLNREGMIAAISDPGAVERFLNLGMSWIYAVFAVGFMLLVIAGTRYVVLTTRRLLTDL